MVIAPIRRNSTPSSEFEFIMKQIARLPTRRALAWLTLVMLFVGGVIGIVGIEAFWRYSPACGL